MLLTTAREFLAPTILIDTKANPVLLWSNFKSFIALSFLRDRTKKKSERGHHIGHDPINPPILIVSESQHFLGTTENFNVIVVT